jgi:CheY-like chemotaxis protein
MVSTRYLNHPALTLGYRLQVDGATVVYACDHEPHDRMWGIGDGKITGPDLRHAEFIAGADLLIHDAQYTAAEYPEKIGWGHSPAEYVVKLARYAGVKRLALTHHDPLRDDAAIERLIAKVRQNSSPVDIFAAFEGQVLEIAGSHKTLAQRDRELPADWPVEVPAPRVVLFVADTATSPVFEALEAENIRTSTFLHTDDVLAAIANRPSLAIVEHDPPRIDGIDICRAIRRHVTQDQLPVILVAGQEGHDPGAAAGVSDWLLKPFTDAYARTKIRAWLLRTASKSSKGAGPARQEPRPSPLHVHAAKGIGTGLKNPRAADKRRRVINPEKSTLLWMYGRDIAPFDTAKFSNTVGEIITRATNTVQPNNNASRQVMARRQ